MFKFIKTEHPELIFVNTIIENKYKNFIFPEEFDYYLCVGGDGTMHKTLSIYKDKPIFGIGLGSYNFLMNPILENGKNKKNYTINELSNIFINYIDNLIENGLHENSKIVESYNINVKVIRENETIFETDSVNDIAIGGDFMDYNTFKLNSKDELFHNLSMQGSGLCISTVMGSSGFNMNNGGAILRHFDEKGEPNRAWSITSVVSTYNINEIIFPEEFIIDILTPKERYNGPRLFIDGQVHVIELLENDRVILNCGQTSRIIFNQADKFFKKTRDLILKRRF
jgi:NAD kinase